EEDPVEGPPERVRPPVGDPLEGGLRRHVQV
ncbi:MAG: hypothetical protein AVDCRST_MAG73-2479, partial [uncultured Thermomicrobiales bacterium]